MIPNRSWRDVVEQCNFVGAAQADELADQVDVGLSDALATRFVEQADQFVESLGFRFCCWLGHPIV